MKPKTEVVSSVNEQNKNLSLLVQKAASGDEAAFGELYELYFEKIYRFVYFRVNHEQTAEDLVAEIFIKAWDSISNLSDEKAFNGWIYQIARNLVIDHYRTRRTEIDITVLENVLEYEQNIVDQANLTINQKQFLENLNKLSEDQQVVIKLKFIEELENSEIAQILDKPEGTIRVIQHRAIKKLKKLLNKNHAG